MQFGQLKRRDFITLLGGAVAAWPIAARGQRRGVVPRLGALLYSTPQADPQMRLVQGGLRELGGIVNLSRHGRLWGSVVSGSGSGKRKACLLSCPEIGGQGGRRQA